MDDSQAPNSEPDDVLKKYPLTVPMAVRGLVCLVVYLLTAFMLLVYLAIFAAVLPRLFSIHYTRKVLEFISVERKWEVDEVMMRKMLLNFTNPLDPLWLALFPEGTDFTEEKCLKSQKFAAENGLPIMKNVLLPKTRGFHTCLEILRGSLDAVYDVTIAYKNRCPTFLDNVFGVEPSEVHVHVRRIPLDDIPPSYHECNSWLIQTFHLKDQLLSDFLKHGHFRQQGTECELSTIKCLVNVTVVIAMTCVFTYLTFFSSIWFRIYVGLACVYLALATTFNFHPSPVVEYVKLLLLSRKKSI
nr:probable 1-acyl-sn-glycerol-3-phosphate acyltransferase 4 [Tanacetum cinerariifolium]